MNRRSFFSGIFAIVIALIVKPFAKAMATNEFNVDEYHEKVLKPIAIKLQQPGPSTYTQMIGLKDERGIVKVVDYSICCKACQKFGGRKEDTPTYKFWRDRFNEGKAKFRITDPGYEVDFHFEYHVDTDTIYAHRDDDGLEISKLSGRMAEEKYLAWAFEDWARRIQSYKLGVTL